MAKPTEPSVVEPRRLRWSVPAADASTNDWLDLQENISRSIQLLIRESIQRDGYIDVVNRPIDQLPRRGRPPVTGSSQGSDDDEVSTDEDQTCEPDERDDELDGDNTAADQVAPSSETEPTVSAPEQEAPAFPAPETPEKPAAKTDANGVPAGLSGFLT